MRIDSDRLTVPFMAMRRLLVSRLVARLVLGGRARPGVEANRLAFVQAVAHLDELLVVLADGHFAALDAVGRRHVGVVLALALRPPPGPARPARWAGG